MNSQGAWVRLAARITEHACRALPEPDRQEWCREWTAELPEFMADRSIDPLPWRVVKMLLWALDHHRGARRLARAAGYRRQVMYAELVDALVVGGCVLLLGAAMGCWGVGMSFITGLAFGGNEYDPGTTASVTRDPAMANLLFSVGACALGAALVVGGAWFWWHRRRGSKPTTKEAAS
jgi:hypothetical protein